MQRVLFFPERLDIAMNLFLIFYIVIFYEINGVPLLDHPRKQAATHLKHIRTTWNTLYIFIKMDEDLATLDPIRKIIYISLSLSFSFTHGITIVGRTRYGYKQFKDNIL